MPKFYRNLDPEIPAGFIMPGPGVYVATWNPTRNGWMYADMTTEWVKKKLSHCLRLFRRIEPHDGTQISLLLRNGQMWGYMWCHVTRYHRSGDSPIAAWEIIGSQATKHAVRRTGCLKWLGIHWRTY